MKVSSFGLVGVVFGSGLSGEPSRSQFWVSVRIRFGLPSPTAAWLAMSKLSPWTMMVSNGAAAPTVTFSETDSDSRRPSVAKTSTA